MKKIIRYTVDIILITLFLGLVYSTLNYEATHGYDEKVKKNLYLDLQVRQVFILW